MTLKGDGVYFKISIFIMLQKLHLLQLLKRFIYLFKKVQRVNSFKFLF